MTRDERRHPERKRRIYYCDEEKDKLKRTAVPYPEGGPFVSSYSVLIAKFCSIPLSKAFIILRS